MAPSQSSDGIVYSGTYSNVPVYEIRVGSNQAMRRRSDNYINATHILKVADLDKPARTRVLEKEVQLGVHEKVQGGYGKYQGTWIPLESGVDLAKKYSVFHLLQPLFEFAPGAESPPPAPKHTTASSNRAKAPRASATRPSQQANIPTPAATAAAATGTATRASKATMGAEQEDCINFTLDDLPRPRSPLTEDDVPFGDAATMASISVVSDDGDSLIADNSRKRKREADDAATIARLRQAHMLWADDLLDFYVVSGSDPHHYLSYAAPPPPPGINVNKKMDNDEHTALHWAASMGDIENVKDLLIRGADIFKGNVRGETALIKCSIFANCYDRGTYQRMVHLLQGSLLITDKYGATVLHHVAKSALTATRTGRPRYYLDVLLTKMSEHLSKPQLYAFANKRDADGNTAAHIAARASRRCVRLFLAAGVPTDVENLQGETVDQMLHRDEKRLVVQPVPGHPFGVMSSSPILAPSPDPFSSPVPASRFGDIHFGNSGSQPKASQSFTKSFSNLMSSQVKHFVVAGEEELRAKEELLRDTSAAVLRANAQGDTVMRQREGVEAEPIEDVASLSEERAQLANTAEAYSEQMQHRYLHAAIREGEHQARKVQEQKNGSANETEEGEVAARIKAGWTLQMEQEARKRLTQKLIEAQAQAGMTKDGELCLRILEKILKKSKEDILSIMPDLIDELDLTIKNHDRDKPLIDTE